MHIWHGTGRESGKVPASWILMIQRCIDRFAASTYQTWTRAAQCGRTRAFSWSRLASVEFEPDGYNPWLQIETVTRLSFLRWLLIRIITIIIFIIQIIVLWWCTVVVADKLVIINKTVINYNGMFKNTALQIICNYYTNMQFLHWNKIIYYCL